MWMITYLHTFPRDTITEALMENTMQLHMEKNNKNQTHFIIKCDHITWFIRKPGWKGTPRIIWSSFSWQKEISARRCWGTEKMWKTGNSTHSESITHHSLKDNRIGWLFLTRKSRRAFYETHKSTSHRQGNPYHSSLSHFYPTPLVLSSIFQQRTRKSECSGKPDGVGKLTHLVLPFSVLTSLEGKFPPSPFFAAWDIPNRADPGVLEQAWTLTLLLWQQHQYHPFKDVFEGWI